MCAELTKLQNTHAAGYASSKFLRGNAMPLAGPDVLVVICIGLIQLVVPRGCSTRSDSFTDVHSLRKIEYKSSFYWK